MFRGYTNGICISLFILAVEMFIVGFILRNKLLLLLSTLLVLNLWNSFKPIQQGFGPVLVTNSKHGTIGLLRRGLPPAHPHPVQPYWYKKILSFCVLQKSVKSKRKNKKQPIYWPFLNVSQILHFFWPVSQPHTCYKTGSRNCACYRLWGTQSGWGRNP